MTILRYFIIFLALLSLHHPANAQLPDFPLNIKAQLESETPQPSPGSSVTIAIVMNPNDGWHGYWENPGDAGVGLQLDWKLPKGVTAGKARFPIPERLIISDLMNFTYEGPHAFLVDLNIDKNIAFGTNLAISVNAQWLACTDRICVPEQDILQLNLVAGDGAITSARSAQFGEFRAKLASPLDQNATYQIQGEEIAISIPLPNTIETNDFYFFPVAQSLLDYQAPQKVTRDGDNIIITTALDQYRDKETIFNEELRAILQIGPESGIELTAKPGIVEGGFDRGFAEDVSSTWILLASAILGGLILNLMPCVFPIIGLKAISLTKLGNDDKAARREALSYSAGVIFSTLALGALLLLLRAGGEQIGWAFQLQSPFMLFILFLLMVFITLNLLGLFELSSITLGQKLTQGSGGSFWTGVLAAFVATPCTGPFMALALGAALILPIYQALMIFFGLGFGLALPYLAIAYIPALRNKMPKAGPWMEIFRKIMAIPMALTAAALFWLLYRVGGTDALLVASVMTILSLALIYIIRRNQSVHKKIAIWPIITFVIATCIGGYFIAQAKPPSAIETKKWVQVTPYDAEKLQQYRDQDQKVFLYFTADWCVTCKINEASAIQREEMAHYFKANDIIVMEGDYTLKDPEIANILYQYQRAGVPLYIYYAPKTVTKILPQILSVDTMKIHLKP